MVAPSGVIVVVTALDGDVGLMDGCIGVDRGRGGLSRDARGHMCADWSSARSDWIWCRALCWDVDHIIEVLNFCAVVGAMVHRSVVMIQVQLVGWVTTNCGATASYGYTMMLIIESSSRVFILRFNG